MLPSRSVPVQEFTLSSVSTVPGGNTRGILVPVPPPAVIAAACVDQVAVSVPRPGSCSRAMTLPAFYIKYKTYIAKQAGLLRRQVSVIASPEVELGISEKNCVLFHNVLRKTSP